MNFSGVNQPSAWFNAAVDEVAPIAHRLLQSLETNAPPKNREVEAAKVRAAFLASKTIA
jgi:hypothetical protein